MLTQFSHRMLRNTFSTLFATTLVVASLSSAAQAGGTQDVQATTIPASACQPANDTSSELVGQSFGRWMFSTYKYGQATLYCPLPINNKTISNKSNKNKITGFRVWYWDKDGYGTDSSVRVRLVRISKKGSLKLYDEWTSNDYTATDHIVASQPFNYELEADHMYSFQVIMKRNSNAGSPMFTGIDFGPHSLHPSPIPDITPIN